MSVTFKPAMTGQAPIITMIAGGTNTGKSWSSLLLARGMVGPTGKIAAVDTEGGRLSSLARYHKFDMAIMEPPFTFHRFTEYAETAEADNYGAILFDSASMMHLGPGGYVDWHEREIKRLCKGDDGKRDAVKWAARREPSMARQAMLYALLARRIPIIFSCRARELTENKGGKVVQIGWQPTIHRELIYDVTLSFTLRPEYGKGIIRHQPPFKLERDHEDIFRDGDLITTEHGERLMAVMRGGPDNSPTYFAIRSDGKRIPFGSLDGWMRWWDTPIEKASPEQLQAMRRANDALIAEYAERHPEQVAEIDRRLAAAISGTDGGQEQGGTSSEEPDPTLAPALITSIASAATLPELRALVSNEAYKRQLARLPDTDRKRVDDAEADRMVALDPG